MENLKSKNKYEQKQKQWVEKRSEIEQITDALGMPIDEGIKDTVIALQLLGINTSSSHEGKLDRYPVPYVDVESFGIDELEKEFYQEVWDQTSDEEKRMRKQIRELWDKSQSIGDSDDPESKKLEQEADVLVNKLQDFPEKRSEKLDNLKSEIKEKNLEVRRSLELLLDEFYKNRKSSHGATLVLMPHGLERTRLTNREADIQEQEENEEVIKKRLSDFQKEMNDFTTFLKNKFFKVV